MAINDLGVCGSNHARRVVACFWRGHRQQHGGLGRRQFLQIGLFRGLDPALAPKYPPLRTSFFFFISPFSPEFVLLIDIESLPLDTCLPKHA